MNLLNTVPLANSLIAHSLNSIAIYADGVVKVYTKNNSNGLDLQTATYTIDGVRELHMSENGNYVAAQTDTQIIRCAKGVQTPFTANGRFAITDTGTIIHLSVATGAAQIITDSTTNITVTLSSNDRVVAGRTKYIIYSATRYLTAAYSDVTYVTTTPAVSILQIFHCGNDRFAVFFSDGTASYVGATRTLPTTLPKMGFRKFGKFLAFTDYKNEYVNSLDGPISDGIFLRKFIRDLPPVADKVSWAKYAMLIVGDTAVAANIDIKNKLAAINVANLTVVKDSPYGITGSSLSFNGTTSVLQTADSANIQLSSSDFTLELFAYIVGGANVIVLVNKGNDVTTTLASYILTVNQTTKKFSFSASTSGTAYDISIAFGTLELNVWTHIAISRQGNNWRCFQDGILYGTATASGALTAASGRGLTIGHTRSGDYTAGAIVYQLSGKLHAITLTKYAKYTANFFVETLPLSGIEAPVAPISDTSPGPQTLAKGTKQLGYYGQVSNADMQNGADLASLVGLTGGTLINASTIWLKFAYQNKIVFIPKQPIRNSVTWNDIYAMGAVFGTDDTGYAPGSPVVNQKKVVQVNTSKYVVRLPQGSDAEVSTSTAYFTQNPTGVQNSEWNALMGRVWESDPTSTFWEKFTAAEMSAVIGAYNAGVWSQESLSSLPAQRVVRNHPPLLGYTGGVTAQSSQSANLNTVWWPVLEWQNPKAPNFNLIDGTTLPANTVVTGAVTVTNNKVAIVPNSFLTIPNDPTLALGTADFEVTIEFTVNAIVSNANGNISTFLFWGTYAQPSQVYNLDIYYYHNDGIFTFAGGTAFDTNLTKSFTFALTVGKAYKISFVRESGVLYFYVNGRRVSSVAYPADLAYKGAASMTVGRRRGGAKNDVYWDSNMDIRSLVIRK